jgi:hypothetical protein
MKWSKAGEVSTARVGPFVVKVQPKGDGRWVWTVWNGDNPNAAATGLAQSSGAARAASENYVNRSGLI